MLYKNLNFIFVTLKNKINTFFCHFSHIIQLPSIYRNNNLLFIIFILFMVISTFLFNTELIFKLINIIIFIHIKIVLINIVLYLTLVYFLFLLFNVIIRIYNMLFKTLPYFIKENNVLNKNLKLLYYCYNSFYLFISLLIMYKIGCNITSYNSDLLDYLLICSFLFSFIPAIVYIDYISENKIIIHNNTHNNLLNYFIIMITILPTFYLLNNFLLLDIVQKNLFKTKLFDTLMTLHLYDEDNNLDGTKKIISNNQKGKGINYNSQQSNSDKTVIHNPPRMDRPRYNINSLDFFLNENNNLNNITSPTSVTSTRTLNQTIYSNTYNPLINTKNILSYLINLQNGTYYSETVTQINSPNYARDLS
jgi:hypothetical protein